MNSVISPLKSRHASPWQLGLIFVLALLLFLALRWQPEPWLQDQIDRQARSHGFDLSYAILHADGLSVRLENVSIKAANLPAPVKLEFLTISPAWPSLLTGEAAVNVQAMQSGQPFDAVLAWHDASLDVQNLHADIDMAALQPFWKQRMRLPVDIAGRLILSGNVQLDMASGLPVDGQLDAKWQQASIDLPLFDKPLGDYQLILKAADSKSGKWQWSLGGGTEVILSGSGRLDLSGKLPQQWMINGRVQLQAAPEARMIAAMLGGQAKAFSISGGLLNARIHPLPQ